ncbi:MAG TPA: class I SAM-dependent methyltransferase [Solirubrobacterales bacterium]|nr:class I SAM-dependent methyltransferase [Solirubrobacterales bacterium]
MSRDDFYASPFGVAYSTYAERPRLNRLIARTVWGGDTRHYYESMGAIREVADGGTIVDCPCGAGVALREVSAQRDVRYVAVDLSPSMLRRTRRRIDKRGLRQAEVLRADATEIPLPDGGADLFLSYWGLHCFEDPAAALAEAARLLEPGGRLVGSTFLLGRDGLRQRLLVRPGVGDFGNPPTEESLRAALEAAGFAEPSIARSGPMAFFDAQLG